MGKIFKLKGGNKIAVKMQHLDNEMGILRQEEGNVRKTGKCSPLV
jgi:hypothetical protein